MIAQTQEGPCNICGCAHPTVDVCPILFHSEYALIEEVKELELTEERLQGMADQGRAALYEPNNPKIAAFHESKAKIRLIVGSNRSGKTHAALKEAADMALGRREWNGEVLRDPPSKVLIVAQDFTNAVLQTIHPKLMSLLPSDALLPTPLGIRYMHSGIPTSYHFTNGSFIKLGSGEQDVQKFEGSDWDLIVFDEIPQREIYIACLRGTIDRGGKVVMAMTPVTSLASWVYDEIYLNAGKDPDIFQVTVSIYDNPHLKAEEIESFRNALSPEEVEARIFGKFKHLIGRVYPGYNQDIHRVDPEKVLNEKDQHGRLLFESYPKGMVIDPADQKPFAIGWFAVTPQNDIIFFREWPETDFFKTSAMSSVAQYAALIKEIEDTIPGGPGTISWRLMDPNYGVKSVVVTGQSIKQEFGDHELHFITDINDKIPDGHNAVRRLMHYDPTIPLGEMNRPKLYFFNNLQNFHNSISKYVWDHRRMEEEKGVAERPKEKYKDFADLVRYTAVFNPTYEDPTMLLAHQRELIDKIKQSRGRI